MITASHGLMLFVTGILLGILLAAVLIMPTRTRHTDIIAAGGGYYHPRTMEFTLVTNPPVVITLPNQK